MKRGAHPVPKAGLDWRCEVATPSNFPDTDETFYNVAASRQSYALGRQLNAGRQYFVYNLREG